MSMFHCQVGSINRRLRDQSINHINNAADGAAAVKQGRRSPYNLQAFCEQRVDAVGMVRTD